MSSQDYAFSGDTVVQKMERQHQWLGAPRKSDYVPAWYTPHKELDLEVTHEGVKQGFSIKHVLPYRRWALDASGATVSQGSFHETYIRYLGAFEYPETHSLAHEYIPNVLGFVSMKRDVAGQLVHILYNDDGRVVKTGKYTQDGDVASEWLEKQRSTNDQLAKITQLADMFARGDIDAETFKRRAALTGSSTDLVPEEELTPEQHAALMKSKRQALMARARAARKFGPRNGPELNREALVAAVSVGDGAPEPEPESEGDVAPELEPAEGAIG